MNQERSHTYPLRPGQADLNEASLLKPHGYLALFSAMMEHHLERIGGNRDTLALHGLAWVLCDLSLEISQPVQDTAPLHGSTWYSRRQGPYFQREFVFLRPEGTPCFQGTSRAILFQTRARRIHREATIPFPFIEPYPESAIPLAASQPWEAPFTPVMERTARPSQIDALGHVNNTRYGEFAYDALTDSQRRALDRLYRIDFVFRSEIRPGARFPVERSVCGPRIRVRGREAGTAPDRTAFLVTFHLRPEPASPLDRTP